MMKFEVCIINKGVLKHLYVNHQGKMWFSSTKATIFSHEEASKLIHDIRIKHLNPFVQAQYECHFREVDEWSFKH